MAQQHDGFGLGRWAVQDPQNLKYNAARKLTTLNPVRWDSDAQPVLDQGELGACTTFTVDDILNTPMFMRNRKRVVRSGFLDNNMALSLYHDATVLDGFKGTYPPVDTGSTGAAAARAAKRRGFWDYYGYTRSFVSFLANLQKQPVMVGTLWTDGMTDPDRNGIVSITGDLVGGHEWMACRYDPRRRLVCGLNHWSKDWGLKGRFWVPVDEMEWLIKEGGDVVVPRPA
jgi:hypothetical protein